jgi:hypothetical protein
MTDFSRKIGFLPHQSAVNVTREPHLIRLNELGNRLTCHVSKNESSDTSIGTAAGLEVP